MFFLSPITLDYVKIRNLGCSIYKNIYFVSLALIPRMCFYNVGLRELFIHIDILSYVCSGRCAKCFNITFMNSGFSCWRTGELSYVWMYAAFSSWVLFLIIWLPWRWLAWRTIHVVETGDRSMRTKIHKNGARNRNIWTMLLVQLCY